MGDDLTGWEVTAAALKVQPEPTLTIKPLLISGTRIDRMAGGAGTMKDVVSREIPDAVFALIPTVVLPPVYLATTYDPGRRLSAGISLHRAPGEDAGPRRSRPWRHGQ